MIDKRCTAFEGDRRLAVGSLGEIALRVKAATDAGSAGILVFDDDSGRVIDINLQGSEQEVLERLVPASPPMLRVPGSLPAAGPAGRGRPKLGVVAREITLLPRHWEWLAKQPGGASVAIRKLVEEARRTGGDKERVREAQEAAYRFLSAMAGNRVGFEEAIRALFAQDRGRFEELIAEWPEDIRSYALQVAFARVSEAT